MVILRSKQPALPIPVIPAYDYVFRNLDEHLNKIAVVDVVTEDQLTFRQYVDQIEHLACGMWELGVRPGSVVGVCSFNSIQYCVTILATLRVGAIVTTANPSYTAGELGYQLKDSGAEFIITIAELLETTEKAIEGNAKIKSIITLNKNNKNYSTYSSLLRHGGRRAPKPKINPMEDLAVIPYSSGTTGRSKGVMLTHYNLVAALEVLNPMNCPTPYWDPCCLSYVPIYHIFGLIHNMFFAATYGYKQVILPRYTPERFCAAIEKHKIKQLKLVPASVIFLAKSPIPRKYDLSSLNHISSGGAPLGEGAESTIMNLYGATLQQGWGMTETVGAGIVSPKYGKIGAAGILQAHSELQIVDPTSGRALGPGKQGEIWFRAPYIMKGYLNNPKATRETITKDGWLKTGDLGYFDEDGYIYVTDRLKELIKVKAMQVAPAELEGLLLQHPDVAEAAVIGVPDVNSGELPKAFVIRKPNSKVTADEVKKYVADRVARYKQLKGGLVFVDEIPKSLSGKILRRVLRDRERKAKAKL